MEKWSFGLLLYCVHSPRVQKPLGLTWERLHSNPVLADNIWFLYTRVGLVWPFLYRFGLATLEDRVRCPSVFRGEEHASLLSSTLRLRWGLLLKWVLGRIGLIPQSNRDHWDSSALSFIGWGHPSAQEHCLIFNMVWIYRSPIPVRLAEGREDQRQV